jgi:hypothetical protein
MRWPSALAACLLAAFPLTCVVARADSVADLDRPSSTIPSCLNVWNPLDSTFSNRTARAAPSYRASARRVPTD